MGKSSKGEKLMRFFTRFMMFVATVVFIINKVNGQTETLEHSGFNVALWLFINLLLSERNET